MANSEYSNYGNPHQQTSSGSSPPLSGAANPGGTPPTSSPAQYSKHETAVAGLAHLSSLFAPLIVPLIIWLVVRDSMPYASRQARQALFFHLLMSAFALVVACVLFYSYISTVFATVSQAITSNVPTSTAIPAWFFACLTFVIIISLSGQALCIYGAVQAFQGKDFSYPLLGRF